MLVLMVRFALIARPVPVPKIVLMPSDVPVPVVKMLLVTFPPSDVPVPVVTQITIQR